MTLDAEFHPRAFLALQMLHHLVAIHTYQRGLVCCYDTVSCQNTYLLSGSAVNHGHHVHGILLHGKLNTYAAEAAFQLLGCLLGIVGTDISAMGIKFHENLWDGIFYK